MSTLAVRTNPSLRRLIVEHLYDLLFEQFTDSLKEAVTDDITQNLNADPRIGVEEIRVTEAEHGIAIQASIRYVPLDITEKMQFIFTEDMANDLI